MNSIQYSSSSKQATDDPRFEPDRKNVVSSLINDKKEHIPDGIYYIVNQATDRYAAILNDDDRTEVVDIDLGLGKNEDIGHKVSLDVCSQQPSNDGSPVVDQTYLTKSI